MAVSRFDPFYEPFADPDNPLYIEPTDSGVDEDWDEELDREQEIDPTGEAYSD